MFTSTFPELRDCSAEAKFHIPKVLSMIFLTFLRKKTPLRTSHKHFVAFDDKYNINYFSSKFLKFLKIVLSMVMY